MSSDTPSVSTDPAMALREGAEAKPDRSYASVIEGLVFATFIAVTIATYFILTSGAQQRSLLTPSLAAALLVANLVPSMGLLVLFGRRIARARAARTAIGGNGRLHVRLVALFSVIAAVPTLLVAIFASLLFQFGVDFWFSDNSRGMFENAASLAQGYKEENLSDVAANTVAMAADLRQHLAQTSVESQAFEDYYTLQLVARRLNQSAIIEVGEDGIARTAVMVDPDRRPAEHRISPDVVKRLAEGEAVIPIISDDRFAAATLIQPGSSIYLYAARGSKILGPGQLQRSQAVLADYNDLFARSKQLQLQFNIALFLLSLMLVGLAVWIALVVADRLVSPVLELVSASHKVAEGDLTVRVAENDSKDEVGTLSSAFNRMTMQLQGQTSALLQANSQLETRHAFIETVLSGVSSGVMSLDENRIVRLLNNAGEKLLRTDRTAMIGQPLGKVAPELDEFVAGKDGDAVVQLTVNGEQRTLAARNVHDLVGYVVTFEDITQQLMDQRRAAWSDVARRIAHEIKNPLTPIQLAAERLQRRYGQTIEGDQGTFEKLTQTIVRQVGDLRRMVDEFSSFARMPKPVFREENLIDLAKQAMFLHEVAHPNIEFVVNSEQAVDLLVCDRRQMAQLFTNIIKNAVEAIGHKPNAGGITEPDSITLDLVRVSGTQIDIMLSDTGVGLPNERSAIVEPYMTTREGGTGLGLAIVKKIVEEHFGDIRFDDRPGGGTVVTLVFNPQLLAPLAVGSEDGDEGLERVPARLTRNMGKRL